MAEALDLLVDLQRQLPGRCQHQRAGAVLSLQPLEDREHERQRLAGAGRRRTDHVLALQRRRDGLCLDGRGRLEAFPLQSGERLLRQAQSGKRHLRPAVSPASSPRMMETSSTDRLLTRESRYGCSHECDPQKSKSEQMFDRDRADVGTAARGDEPGLARIALRARRARAAHRHDDGSGSRGLIDAPVPAWIECILSRWIPCGGTTSSRPVGRRQRRKRARRWK